MAKTRFEIAHLIIEAELTKPYVYGTADCFFFGCRIADAFDPARKMVKTYSGSYKTLMGAQRAMRKRGFKSLAELVAVHLEPCAPGEAQFGDLVILQLADGEHVGVCVGAKFITKTERGRSLHDLSAVKAAFRT
ncbi:DUF6950 family protein [Aquamicrobium ahrensii]|uniref:DUF6950 domain-containing protein n=1 Tax=Aquamicrobium ahrensii TaxID=469551 RepID=A0ABV2KR51_9HYPH